MPSMTDPGPYSLSTAWRAPRLLLGRIAGERSTPARLGWAVALGVLIGTTPFYGFHLAICLLAATALRLNRAITYLAANISLPWVTPLLIFGSVQLGSLLLAGHWLPMSLDFFKTVDPWQFALTWLLGSLALGTLLGAPLGLVTFLVMRGYRRTHPLPRDPVAEAMERATARFRDQGSFVFRYVRGKFEYDPVYRFIADRSPLPEPIVDVGCGRGQTLVLLAEMQPGVRGTGIDWDESKLALARQAAAGMGGLRFKSGDIRSVTVDGAGTLLLIDVLHYQTVAAQDEMLRQAARSLLPDGVLYIRDVDARGGLRARISRWHEQIGRLIRFNRGATLCFRPAAQLVDVLASEGLVSTVSPASALLPFSNVIIEARRAG
jgi:SAM-dependent methyltransferase